MIFIRQFGWLLLGLLVLPSSSLARQEAVVDPGEGYFQSGHFEQAVEIWGKKLSDCSAENSPAEYIDMSIRLAAAYQSLGHLKKTGEILLKAESVVNKINDSIRRAVVLSQLSDVYSNFFATCGSVAKDIKMEPAYTCVPTGKSHFIITARDLLPRSPEDLRTQTIHLQGNEVEKESKPPLSSPDQSITGHGRRAKLNRKESNPPLSSHDQSLQPVTQDSPSWTRETVLNKAQNYLEQAEQIMSSQQTENSLLLLANILNKKGNLLVAQEKYDEAITVYQQSVKLSDQVGDKLLSAKTLVNMLQAMMRRDKNGQLKQELSDKTVFQRIQQLPDSHDKAFALIRLAYLAQSLQPFAHEEKWFDLSPLVVVQTGKILGYTYEVLQQAIQVAKNQQDNLALAYAKGHLAQFYAAEKRYEEAIRLTRQAISSVNTDKGQTLLEEVYPEVLYRWEWQLGKFLNAQGHFQDALEAYKRANRHLSKVPLIYRCIPLSLRKTIQEFYLELAELQFKNFAQETTVKETTVEEKQQLLKRLIENIESFKTAELQSYLQPTNIVKQKSIYHGEQDLPEGTAVIYPILLDNGVKLVMISRDGIRLNASNTSKRDLETEVKNFRGRLQQIDPKAVLTDNRSQDWLLPAQRLYQWLIQPIKQELVNQGIDTLVIVPPQGELTTIPFAALHDGKQYLVAEYKLVVTPSLNLTDTSMRPFEKPRALLVGVSIGSDKPSPLNSVEELGNVKKVIGGETLQNDTSPGRDKFSPSIYVESELKSIKEVIGGEILQNDAFLKFNLTEELRKNRDPYTVIHFATYGLFDSEPAKMPGTLRMEVLEEIFSISSLSYREPVELITFSTSGPVQASEMLVKVASMIVKTGARSALASLWNVSDYATARLMTEFYQQWKENHFSSKAKALQQAQLKLLRTPELKHPYFWAAFVLIGNWQ